MLYDVAHGVFRESCGRSCKFVWLKPTLPMIPKLIDAIPQPAYQLCLTFDDGTKGNIDLSGWVGNGVFTVWNNPENFSSFIIDKLGKLIWSDEIDMDPDAFYLELIGKSFEEYARDKQVLRHHH